MPYKPTDNHACLFKNRKKTTDKHPDHAGILPVMCPKCGVSTEFYINGWNGTTKKGEPYLSMAITEKKKKESEVKDDSERKNS